MRVSSFSGSLILLATLTTTAFAQNARGPQPPTAAVPGTITIEEIVKRAAQSENTVITNVKAFKPIVEVYIQNVRVPGMLHGRIVRPRGQAVFGSGVPIVSVDEKSVAKIPGARIVRKGKMDRAKCVEFWGKDVDACNEVP